MADLIDRQAALDVLDILIADSKRIAGDNKLVQKAVNLRRGMREIVAKLPTADAVEVVRCKDCKHNELCVRQLVFWERDHVLEQNVYKYHDLDFCSYGERREENTAD